MVRAFFSHAITVGDVTALVLIAGAAGYFWWVAIGCPGSRERRR